MRGRGPSLAPWAAGSGGQPPAGPCAPLHELPPTGATRRRARGRGLSLRTSCRGALAPCSCRRASDERPPAVGRRFVAAHLLPHVPARGFCVGQRHDRAGTPRPSTTVRRRRLHRGGTSTRRGRSAAVGRRCAAAAPRSTSRPDRSSSGGGARDSDPGCACRRRRPAARDPAGPAVPRGGETDRRRAQDHARAAQSVAGGSPTLLADRSALGQERARRVSDGTRTRDHLDHNQELYQLSYAHRGGRSVALCVRTSRPAAPRARPSCRTGGEWSVARCAG
jgi:hypothetical protein